MQMKKYSTCQWLFIFMAVVMFMSMNLGVLKYNDIYVWGTAIGLTILTLYVGYRYKSYLNIKISNKIFYTFITGIFIITFACMAVICYNVPLAYYSDFFIVKDQAMIFAKEFRVGTRLEYFHSYPFNVNTALILGGFYKFFGEYHAVELATSTMVNLAAIFTGLTICNLTKNRFVSLVVMVLYEIFSLFCLKTYLPYSSNLVVLFTILIVYFYTMEIRKTIKVVLMCLAAAIGMYIKITALIPLIGIGVIEGYFSIKNRDWKSIIVALISVVVCIGGIKVFEKATLAGMGFEKDPTLEHNIIYYIAMGQNNEYGGQYYSPIAAIGDEPRPKSERDSLFLHMAIQEVKARGILGQVKFFVSKIAICWGEIRQDHLYFTSIDKVLIALRHYTWYLAQSLMLIGIFLIRDKRYLGILLGIFGAVFYLYLSEAGARYVIMYTPIVYVLGGWAICKFDSIKQHDKL